MFECLNVHTFIPSYRHTVTPPHRRTVIPFLMLDDMHLRKIDLADEIFVINSEGYIGESTRREIEYAQESGMTVKYLID